MFEVYADDAAIKAHQDSQHFKDFRPVVGDLVADRKVEVLQHGVRRQDQNAAERDRQRRFVVGGLRGDAGLAGNEAAMAAIKVVCSGGSEPRCWRWCRPWRPTGLSLAIEWGSSVAGTPTSIPARMDRGEAVDVVIGSSASLVGLLGSGPDPPGHTCSAGAIGHRLLPCAPARAKPEVGTVEALTRTLLACRSIAISTSASGITLDKLFARLAIDGALSSKIIRAEATPVGEIVGQRRGRKSACNR